MPCLPCSRGRQSIVEDGETRLICTFRWVTNSVASKRVEGESTCWRAATGFECSLCISPILIWHAGIEKTAQITREGPSNRVRCRLDCERRADGNSGQVLRSKA